MSRCRNCGAYVDPFEWPAESAQDFRPDLCFNCFSEARDNGTLDDSDDDNSESEEQEEEPQIDPDIDDSPCFPEDSETTNESQEDSNDDDTESGEVPDETKNLRELKRMLFG